MKPGQLPRSPDAFHKWSDQHRTEMWEMIEKLGKGEVSYKEARELLREERKALTAVSKRVFAFKTSASSSYSAPHLAKAPKSKRPAAPTARVQPRT